MSPLPLLVLGLATALRVPGPLSPRIASYQIEVRLDATTRELVGKETLTWRNTGTAGVRSLPLHLYMNAFKNERSVFMTESKRELPPIELEQGLWGLERLTSVEARTKDAQPIVARQSAALTDESVTSIELAREVAPGETIVLSLGFVTRLPKIISRAGVEDGFFAVAQWFPKIGVYACDPSCTFSAAAYHSDSEFYADFGVYDVVLDVPRALVVGATGVLVDEQTSADRKTLRYHAEDVHDFVWAADARFVSQTIEVDDALGLPPVTVRLLGVPALAGNAERHLATARASLLELGRRLGPYPYRELTIVQVFHDAADAGGMEYPTLLFTEDEPSPRQLYAPELVTAHEIAHQWFQGVVASDEVEEPWLDEGLTEFATSWVMERITPPRALLYRMFGHELSYAHMERTQLAGERADALMKPAYAFRDRHVYAELVYRKTSLLLATLRARLGDDAFFRSLRSYVDRHRFLHPHTGDFLAAFDDAPPDLRALLLQGITEPGTLDYAITKVHTTQDRAAAGLFDVDGGTREVPVTPPAGGYHSEIVVERLGELRVSLTVRAHFFDGSFEDRALPAEASVGSRWRRIELASESGLAWAELSPHDDTPLDERRWNDGLRTEPDARPRRRLVQSIRILAAILLSWCGR